MKKKAALILFFFALNTPIHSQVLVPFLKKNEKYIYVDSATMKEVKLTSQEYPNNADNQGEFEVARMFYNGLAVVKKGGKWGVISKKGLMIAQYKYDWVGDFYGNISVFKLGNKCGLINNEGEIVLSPKYTFIYPFSEGIARVYNEFEVESEVDVLNSVNGKIIPKEKIKNRKYGFIDISGREVVPVIYDEADDFLENFARVVIKSNRGSMLSGVLGRNGEIVLPLIYNNLSKVSEGLTIACHTNNKDSAWIELINTRYNSKKLLNYKWKSFYINNYNNPISFRNGLIPFIEEYEGIGILDSAGNEILKPTKKYSNIFNFFEGFAMVESNDNKIGFINKVGEEVIPMKYEKIDWFQYDFGFHKFSEGLACVKLKNKIGFIDYSGNEIIQFKFDDIHSDFNNGFASVSIGNSTFYIDKSGNEYREQ